MQVKAGNTYRATCSYLGIAERTFFRWLSEGENADDGIKRHFWQTIKASEAEVHIRNIIIIQKAAQSDWKAAAWFLERRFPQRWGKSRRNLTGIEGEPVDVEIVRQKLIEKLNAIGHSDK
ncbi:MAG TPA: hypothetical protein VMW91_11720 [Desulfosporosinus sp.]|nr:hypothetical protein [Desulfosporosinus sp.]